jgi:SAM-dependent methyltransferase
MNASIKDQTHASIVYYDSDYPSRYFSRYPENFDEIVEQQGIADDVYKYQRLARQYGNRVLELCCGTGRIAIPLAAEGCTVTAVDVSGALLNRLKTNQESIENFPYQNLSVVKQDVTELSLPQRDFDLIICAFNSLLCIPDRDLQQKTLFNAAAHLRPHGLLALDIWNPLVLNLEGDKIPESYFTRKRTDNGNQYTRFAATGKMNAEQVQPVYGWYDETTPDGTIKRTPYNMEWRIIFRYEMVLMLEKAGFQVTNIYGGNRDEPFETHSLKMFFEAIKI